jgi:superfamily II DNA or RNA helicase
MRGGLGLRLDCLKGETLAWLQKRLTLTSRPYKDNPPQVVRSFRIANGYFWVPRFFDWMEFWPKIQPAGWQWVCPVLDYDLESKFTPIVEKQQPEAIETLVEHLKKNSSGICVLPTDVGKTYVALEIGRRFQTPMVVLVFKGDMIDNWVEHAESHLGIPAHDVAIIKENSYAEGKPVTICSIQTLLSRDLPPHFYEQFGYLIADECVSGDTLIETDCGPVPISKIPEVGANSVLCYDEHLEQWCFRKIKRWIPQGTRKTLTIRAEGGQSLRCTPEHPLRTQRGWVRAASLRPGDRLLSPVDADVDKRFPQKITVEDHGGSNEDIAYHAALIGINESQISTQPRLFANVSAESGYKFERTSFNDESRTINGHASNEGTTAHDRNDPLLSNEPSACCLGLFSETRQLFETMENEQTHESSLITDRSKKGGANTKEINSEVSISGLSGLPIKDSERRCIEDQACVIQGSTTSTKSLVTQNVSPHSGLIASQTKVGRGGTWMMDRAHEKGFDSIQKDSHKQKSLSLPHTCRESSACAQSLNPLKRNTGGFDYESPMPLSGLGSSEPSRTQSVWTTNFQTVMSVIEDPSPGVPVYDLEIDEHHNFVANGLLVHNCHHYGADQWSKVISRFPARYRLGISANPVRDDGLDPVVRWNFGKVGFGIYKRKVGQLPLVCLTRYPGVYNERKYHDWKQIQTPEGPKWVMGSVDALKYAKQLAADKDRNSWLVGKIMDARSKGRRILIFSKLRAHIKALHDEFVQRWTESTLQAGGDPKDTRVKLLWGGLKTAERKIAMTGDVTFTTYGFSREATNLPHKDTLVVATPAENALQTVGRLRDKGAANRMPFMVVDVFEGNDYSFKKASQRVQTYASLGIKVKRFEVRS